MSWELLIRSGSDAFLNSLNVGTYVNAQSLTGSLDWSNLENVPSGINTGSAQDNEVLFWKDGGITGSQDLYWDDTNGRLGIGTNSPSYALYVESSETIAGRLSNGTHYVTLADKSSGAYGMKSNGPISVQNVYVSTNGSILSNSGDLNLKPAQSTAMTLKSTGRVGIGNSNPSGELDVSGSAIRIKGNAPSYHLIDNDSGGWQFRTSYSYSSDRDLQFKNTNTQKTTFLLKGSNGFLGLSPHFLNPSQRLHISGSLRIEDGGIYDKNNANGTSGQILQSDGSAIEWIDQDSITAGTASYVDWSNIDNVPTGINTGSALDNEVLFWKNGGITGSQDLYWNDTNGRLGINTTSPTRRLDVNGAMRLRGHLRDSNNSAGSNGNILSRDSGGIIWEDASNVTAGTASYIDWPNIDNIPVGLISSSAQVDHDSTTNFVLNEHINHSSVSIIAGSGLTGGGDITTSRTLNVGAGTGINVNANDIDLDILSLTTTSTLADDDYIAIYDISSLGIRKISIQDMPLSLFDNDAGFVTSDTNFYLESGSFNVGNGILDLNVNGSTDVQVDLDGRYLQFSQTGSWAENSISSSYSDFALTASYVENAGSDYSWVFEYDDSGTGAVYHVTSGSYISFQAGTGINIGNATPINGAGSGIEISIDPTQATGSQDLQSTTDHGNISTNDIIVTGSGVYNLGVNGSYQQESENVIRLAGTSLVNTIAGKSAGGTSTNQTAFGFEANNSGSGDATTAIGHQAGLGNTGAELTAVGHGAADGNTTSRGTIIGYQSGINNIGTHLTTVGWQAGNSNDGDNSTFVGYNVGLNNAYDNVHLFGYNLEANKSNQVRLGTNFTTEEFKVGNWEMIVSQSLGATEDGYVATFRSTTGKILFRPAPDNSPVSSIDQVAVVSNALTVNFNNDRYIQTNVDQNTQIQFTNGSSSTEMLEGTLELTNETGVSFILQWHSSILWPNGGSPPGSIPAETVSLYKFEWNGGNWINILSAEDIQ